MFAQLLGFTLLALTQRALAHGGVLAISNGGNWYDGWQPYDTPVGTRLRVSVACTAH